MEVTLEAVSKRFSRQWIFKDLSLHIPQGSAFALTGRNGSGKSTLLKLISGALPPSAGSVKYKLDNMVIPSDKLYRHLSFAAPYNKLIEEFTISEAYQFHARFRRFYPEAASIRDFLDVVQFPFKNSSAIKGYSSGMKQRLQLALAICTQGALLILDEPGSNLDREGRGWFQEVLGKFHQSRTVLIASNQEEDLQFCKQTLEVEKLNFLASSVSKGIPE